MKRCPYCGRYYRQDPRARVQACCGRAECQRARKRKNLRRWRSLHPGHGSRYAAKERAWAKAYPDYWRAYRAGHPNYAARDNLRRVENRRRAKLSANETGIRQDLVEKLRALEDAGGPEMSANETGFLRRMSAIEDCLRTTAAVALSAKRNRVDGLGAAAP
jgi:hypothetical protein